MSNLPALTQQDRIERMLSALLKSDNHIQWIGGYVYGRTSKGDPFIVLYPASDKLDRKACRVYDHEFKKLPQFVDLNVPINAQNANPDRSQAVRMGIYKKCQLFQITLFDGRKTEMGPEQRFGDIVRISGNANQNQQAATTAPNGKAPQALANGRKPVAGVRPVVKRKSTNNAPTPPPPPPPAKQVYTRKPVNGRASVNGSGSNGGDEVVKTAVDLKVDVLATFVEDDFNTAVVEWLDYFQDAGTVAVARQHMWGGFEPEHVGGYAAGLLSYAGSVTTQIATGRGLDKEFKQTAVKKAKLAFTKEVKKQVAL